MKKSVFYKIYKSDTLVFKSESKQEALKEFKKLPNGHDLWACVELGDKTLGITLVETKK